MASIVKAVHDPIITDLVSRCLVTLGGSTVRKEDLKVKIVMILLYRPQNTVSSYYSTIFSFI